MAISDHDRKLLWGRSGNRCAICRRLLVIERTDADRESVVGDECHIESGQDLGPRGGVAAAAEVDRYDNLILLCKVDHKRVDDQTNTFPPQVLRAMKLAHERWVDLALSVDPPRTQRVTADDGYHRVSRIQDGSTLLRVVGGCQGYDFDNDRLEDEAEVTLLASFLQKLHDLGEVYDDLESGDRVNARHDLQHDLDVLEAAGFIVYGSRGKRRLAIGGERHEVWVSSIRIMRITNPSIWDPGVAEEAKRRTENGDAREDHNGV